MVVKSNITQYSQNIGPSTTFFNHPFDSKIHLQQKLHTVYSVNRLGYNTMFKTELFS